MDRFVRGRSFRVRCPVEAVVDDGAHRTISPGPDLERSGASSIHSVAAKALVQTDNSHAGSKALLRVRPVGKNLLAEQRNLRPDGRSLAPNAFDRPVGEAAVGRGHVIGDRRVLAVTAGAAMCGYSLASVEDLDRIGGDARLDLLASEAIGDGV